MATIYIVSHPSKTRAVEIYTANDEYEAKQRAAELWGIGGPLTRDGSRMTVTKVSTSDEKDK